MQGFLITLLTCSVTMSVLAFLYIAVTPLLAKRYSVKERYYAWLIIVIGLIIPFRPQFDNAVVKISIPNETIFPLIQIGNGVPSVIPVQIENTVVPSAAQSFSWWQTAVIIWAVGVAVFIAYHAIKHYRFVKIIGRWSDRITDGQLLLILQCLKAEMGISQQIDLCLCSCIGSPLLIGFVKPCILLPHMNFNDSEIRFILRHELVHFKRKDLYYKFLVLIAAAIHWFNPVIHFMTKAIDALCEISCDAETVQSTNADTRLYYSEMILGVVRYQSKLKTALSTNFNGGKKGMKKRIFSIMDMSKKKTGIVIICAALIITLGTSFALAANAENSKVSAPISSVKISAPPQDNTSDSNVSELNHTPIEDDVPALDESSTATELPATQIELKSPYRLAATLEEVRSIIALDDGTIPVTNVEVPEIMNGQANGIIITEQNLEEALNVLDEAYRMEMGVGVDAPITNLTTSNIGIALSLEEDKHIREDEWLKLTAEEQNEAEEQHSIFSFAYDIIESADEMGTLETSVGENGLEGIEPEVFERIEEEARRVFELYGEISDERARESALYLFGNN